MKKQCKTIIVTEGKIKAHWDSPPVKSFDAAHYVSAEHLYLDALESFKDEAVEVSESCIGQDSTQWYLGELKKSITIPKKDGIYPTPEGLWMEIYTPNWIHPELHTCVLSFDKQEPTCGDCGKELTLVRPGKHQCDNPECLHNADTPKVEEGEKQEIEIPYENTNDCTNMIVTVAPYDIEYVDGLREKVRKLTMMLDDKLGTPCEQIRSQQKIQELEELLSKAREENAILSEIKYLQKKILDVSEIPNHSLSVAIEANYKIKDLEEKLNKKA